MPDAVSLDAARLARAMGMLATDTQPIAVFLHEFFAALTEQGFSREEALHLTGKMEDFMLRRFLPEE